jgi:hypothetical protein
VVLKWIDEISLKTVHNGTSQRLVKYILFEGFIDDAYAYENCLNRDTC